MKQQRRPTIKRIAALAEVSRGTVDRALNNRSGVDPAVAERIRRIADELGYAPHKAAKSLRFNHSPKTIGIVLPSVNRAFFDQIVEGVHQAAQELRDMGIGTTVNTVDAADDTLVERAMNDMIEAHVAGLIITGPDTARVRSAVNRAVEVGIPVITINSDIPDSKRLCFVGQDLAKSGRVAGELMAKTVCGSGRVLAITGNLNFQAHNDRIVGFREGLLRWAHDLEVDVREGFDTYQGTFDAVRNAFAEAQRNGLPIRGVYMATGNIDAALELLQPPQALTMNGHHVPQRRPRVITNDVLPVVTRGLQEGAIDFTIFQDPVHQGYVPVKTMYNYLLTREPPESEWYQSPIRIMGASELE
jgi:LacI family transcriptional regulator